MIAALPRRLVWFVAALAVATFVPTVGISQPPAEPARSSPEAHQKFSGAVALQNRGEYDLAADAWSDFLKAHADDALASKARHYRGVCWFQLQKYDAAQADFEQVIKNSPDLDVLESTYVNLGLSFFNQAQGGGKDADAAFDRSIEVFRAQLSKFPNGEFAPMASYYQAEALYTRKKSAEAIAVYRKFLEKHPEHALRPDALYGLGVAQAETNDAAAARATFEAFLKSFPGHALADEVTMRLGDALFALGKLSEAAPHFAAAADSEKFEHADYARLRQAACQFETGDFAGAAKLYAQVANKNPPSPHAAVAALNAGKSLLRDGKYDAAAKWLQKAYGGGGAFDVEAAHWLARAELAAGRPAEALGFVEKAIASSPPAEWNAPLALDRADALYAIPERRADAVGAYEAIAAKHAGEPKAADALYLAADSALAIREYAKAAALAARYLGQYPKHEAATRVRHIAAEAQLQLKDFNAAATSFKTLLTNHPQDKNVGLWRNRQRPTFLSCG